ncbi:MAG: hypothetical protein J3K34DRAFT_405843 [Monoraphidium minutum]|nr:MAG: hypothetical protein J3K34DRAFT_405843 [Monoraphidium minutum]
MCGRGGACSFRSSAAVQAVGAPRKAACRGACESGSGSVVTRWGGDAPGALRLPSLAARELVGFETRSLLCSASVRETQGGAATCARAGRSRGGEVRCGLGGRSCEDVAVGCLRAQACPNQWPRQPGMGHSAGQPWDHRTALQQGLAAARARRRRLAAARRSCQGGGGARAHDTGG